MNKSIGPRLSMDLWTYLCYSLTRGHCLLNFFELFRKEKRFRMWKQKQKSEREYTFTQWDKNKTNNNSKWKVKTQKIQKHLTGRNKEYKMKMVPVVDYWQYKDDPATRGGISKWYINREPWWENKDSKHNRMTWMKASASKQHTQTWHIFGIQSLVLQISTFETIFGIITTCM